ncbi:MAG: hypothetical protein IPJ07_20545 [Acidobacteria bacterium]|nr:hypothetical protein [Acidobacteriota bacterium]
MKLHTSIFIPKNMTGRLPIILERTPYQAPDQLRAPRKPEVWKQGAFVDEGFIFVFQDIWRPG